MNREVKKTLNAIAQAIYDKKGMNILALDVQGISSLGDYVIIAEGTIDRHVKALCRAIQEALEQQNVKPLYVEGESDGDWIVMDYSDVAVHLLIPDFREKYALEDLWKEGGVVDLQIKTQKKSKEEDFW